MISHDPRTADFWRKPDALRRDRARLDHRITTLYGLDALVGLLDDERSEQQANEKLRYLM